MPFEVSGIEVAWWHPPLVAYLISTIVSTAGVSGAFLLLPYQVSVLGFVSPAVTPTNHLYNVVSIPSGVYRYFKEGRMLWPLAWIIVLGTLPGVALGSWLRIRYLPDPATFKLFVGAVLLFIGWRLIKENLLSFLFAKNISSATKPESPELEVTSVEVLRFDWKKLSYRFSKKTFELSSPMLFLLSAIVGVVGGAYGVGGGAIISPFLISFFSLPVYTIAGATLLGTFLTSVFGVVLFTVLAPLYGGSDLAISPDWMLGFLFGVGGFCGMYSGARLQRYVPQRAIKIILALVICSLAFRYIYTYFF